MIADEKLVFMVSWAARYGAHLEARGEVGFFRACVGIVHGKSYLDYMDIEMNRELWKDFYVPDDAYHKHPCLAVLVRGSEPEECDYDKALEQLYTWVKWLDDNKFGMEVEPRQTFNEPGSFGSQLELLMGGTTNPKLVKLS